MVPLQYVGAQTILKLMDSFATRAGSVRADSTRNLLLIQGTGDERRSAVDTALSFDVDWMRGQSVGIYPIHNSAPEPMIGELEKIMDTGDSGLSQNLVKFQAVSRLNAIMVVSRKPALLQTAATWIRRLDRSNSERNSVHVYRIRYGDARQLAKVLSEMFVGNSSAPIDSAESQSAPGSGGTTPPRSPTDCHSTSISRTRLRPPTLRAGWAQADLSRARRPRRSAASQISDWRRSGGGSQPATPNIRITADADQ